MSVEQHQQRSLPWPETAAEVEAGEQRDRRDGHPAWTAEDLAKAKAAREQRDAAKTAASAPVLDEAPPPAPDPAPAAPAPKPAAAPAAAPAPKPAAAAAAAPAKPAAAPVPASKVAKFTDLPTGSSGICCRVTPWKMQVNSETKATAFTARNEHGRIAYIIRERPAAGTTIVKVQLDHKAAGSTDRIFDGRWTCATGELADAAVKTMKAACLAALRLPLNAGELAKRKADQNDE